MAKSFAASVAAFGEKTKVRMGHVFKEAVQDVIDEAQMTKAKGGRMPVKDGFLRNSLVGGIGAGDFQVRQPARMGDPGALDGSYEVTIESMTIGDVARFAWTAAYAMRMEMGFAGTDKLGRTYEQPGNFFVGSAAAKWQTFVDKQAAKVKD
ncbi:MAG: HK97 gp10 family phage protein [Rhodobiaceae bacterium]|nr:HK97 gp10 family phage protein [Rhodobiaceae bacterium]MCC0051873.1 HK97 gp10 family phage protein [Rhodobiaceae bacterium]